MGILDRIGPELLQAPISKGMLERIQSELTHEGESDLIIRINLGQDSTELAEQLLKIQQEVVRRLCAGTYATFVSLLRESRAAEAEIIQKASVIIPIQDLEMRNDSVPIAVCQVLVDELIEVMRNSYQDALFELMREIGIDMRNPNIDELHHAIDSYLADFVLGKRSEEN
ncbi:MAG TPA: hypothetical protein VJB60_00720 [Candidatus Peribacterales bacterium]|nr:hypothetical protein [Candidatus Peribacterales bacterium]